MFWGATRKAPRQNKQSSRYETSKGAHVTGFMGAQCLARPLRPCSCHWGQMQGFGESRQLCSSQYLRIGSQQRTAAAACQVMSRPFGIEVSVLGSIFIHTIWALFPRRAWGSLSGSQRCGHAPAPRFRDGSR